MTPPGQRSYHCDAYLAALLVYRSRGSTVGTWTLVSVVPHPPVTPPILVPTGAVMLLLHFVIVPSVCTLGVIVVPEFSLNVKLPEISMSPAVRMAFVGL